MESAKHLLESSFLSIKEIAHRVGLNDESHFVRDFKKAYGVPPSLYRLRSHGAHLDESKIGFERAARSANEKQEEPNNIPCH